MKCGFKTIDITPPVGVPMGGNVREDVVSRGVHDSLFADIIVFDNGSERLVLIDLDWCEAALEEVRFLKTRIAEKAEISYSRICITMTHTHSGPDIAASFAEAGIPEITRNYIRDTAEKIAFGVKNAIGEMQDILIGVGKSSVTDLSYNRRVFFKDQSLHMNWEILESSGIDIDNLDYPEGPIDEDLFVVKFCDTVGKLKAILVNFTLHAAILVMEDLLFSKDFIWALEERLKQRYGSDVLVYFSNGAEGNINHIDMWNPTQKRSWYETERIGTKLAGYVEHQVDQIEVHETDTLIVQYKSIEIPVRNISEQEVQTAEKKWKECGGIIPSIVDGVPEEWYAGNILKLANDPHKTRELELQTFKIDGMAIATLPCELFVEFGQKIKKNSPFPDTFLFGLANQSIGYVPTQRAFLNGGYEPQTCESSILVPEAGNIICDNLLELIGTMAAGTVIKQTMKTTPDPN
jgi:neutral ceramidase